MLIDCRLDIYVFYDVLYNSIIHKTRFSVFGNDDVYCDHVYISEQLVNAIRFSFQTERELEQRFYF